VKTDICRHFNQIVKFILATTIWWLFLKNCSDGSQTSIYAAIEPELEAHGGAYLSECAVAQPNQLTADKLLWKRLWEESETITHTSFLSSATK